MSGYRHFDDELISNNNNSAAILPGALNNIHEAYRLEFTPQFYNYYPRYRKFSLNHLKICLSRRTNLECFLMLLIICFFILFILIISVRLFRKQNSIKPLCLNPSCIQASYVLSSGMNQSVDPCEDFHEFVCGRWIRTNIIPKGSSTWSTTRELAQKNTIVLKTIFEQTSTASLVTAEQEAIKFYQSCMNTSEIERLHVQPLEKFFQLNFNLTIKEWTDLDKSRTWKELFIYLTRVLATKYDFSYVLPISIRADEKNSTWNAIHIDQPQLILDSRDYYINQSNARNQIIRDTYSKVGSEVLQLLGFEKNDSIKRMNDIIQFEIELATISLPMEVLQKPDETYFIMTLKQLQDQYEFIQFDIYSFFNDMFNINISNPIKINENDQLIVLSLDLMSKLATILKDYLLTPNKSHVVIDYLLVSLVFDLNSYLSSDFVQTILPLNKELFGVDSLPERWEYCVKKTDAAFGFAVGALYIDAVFGETDRIKANELIKNIRQMFEDNLDKLEWIDEESKSEARKKLEKMKQKIGYPDFIKNEAKLNEYYQGYSMTENEYFDNIIKVLNRDRRRSLLKFQQKVDPNEWDMTPRTVNAYYLPPVNEIVFPAGILQPPFFHKDLPLAINYGAIGSVIGHEITHGFDNQGRQYDADGNLRSWWTNQSVDNFEEKTKCFIERYSNFSIDGQNENGLRTLGENIADNGGTKLSYLAYQKHKQQTLNSDNNLRLPGFEYNNDQLFFIAFAHSWCTVQTQNALLYGLINDPHSPGRLRVIGTVGNSDEFAKAFSCKPKSTMNPSNKCYLW